MDLMIDMIWLGYQLGRYFLQHNGFNPFYAFFVGAVAVPDAD